MSALRPVSPMKTTLKPDLSYLPTFNDVGGRPNERRGTRGSFTPGVRIISGGVRRDMPLETKINPGQVLSVSDKLKPNISGKPRTNAMRHTERLGTQGVFSPGVKTLSGGSSCDVLIATKIEPGQVLFVSLTLEPDMPGGARTNAVRPSDRLRSRGISTRGVRLWMGSYPRNIPVIPEIPHGEVLFVSCDRQPELLWEGETNLVRGRDNERRERLGSFEHGVVKAAGGPLHMPPSGNLELWHESGQRENKFRSCGPSHFVAGVSILPGGMPMYTLEI